MRGAVGAQLGANGAVEEFPCLRSLLIEDSARRLWSPSNAEFPDQTVDLVGAPEVNRKIHEWMDRAKEIYAAGGVSEEAVVEEEQELPSVLRKDDSSH